MADDFRRSAIGEHDLIAGLSLRHAIRETHQYRLEQCIIVMPGKAGEVDETEQVSQLLLGCIAEWFVDSLEKIVMPGTFARPEQRRGDAGCAPHTAFSRTRNHSR